MKLPQILMLNTYLGDSFDVLIFNNIYAQFNLIQKLYSIFITEYRSGVMEAGIRQIKCQFRKSHLIDD